MQQDATSRVDEERVREPAEMEVDDRTEHGVDRDVYARHAPEQTVGNDRQTRRRHHAYQHTSEATGDAIQSINLYLSRASS